MQPRSLGVAIALVALVGFAGCSAFGTAGPSAGEGTVTPAPVPTAEPSPPPGVTADGVRDPERLGIAHEQRLTNESYAVTVVRTVRFDNGTTVRRLERGRTVGDGGVILSWRTETAHSRAGGGTVVSRRAWSNESVRVMRFQYANESTRYVVTASPQRYPYRRTAHSVGEMLSSEDAAVVASDTDADPPTYTLLARNLSDSLSTNPNLDRVETSSIRAVVTGRGLLRRASIRYTGTRDGTPAVAGSTIRFDTDPDPVTRPEWVETALQQEHKET
ncbi:hypothetical protein [Haloarcula mannanilytica]|uniref:hypothetical protein n=1 Tax=Haloarcula mannanilytica TaxID=2509225 RepID=UPI0010F929F0|nr:hypothetical protein [Haloarcula mannanilytica]